MTFLFYAVATGIVALVIYGVLALFLTKLPSSYLTIEQRGRIARDNQLRQAFHDYTIEHGHTPTVRELWLYSPPNVEDSSSIQTTTQEAT